MNIDFGDIEKVAANFTARDKTISKFQAYDLAVKAIQLAALTDISTRLGQIESKLNSEKR